MISKANILAAIGLSIILLFAATIPAQDGDAPIASPVSDSDAVEVPIEIPEPDLKDIPAPDPSGIPQVFTDIELSPEGVIAVDSAGVRWTYDFGAEKFIRDVRFGPGRIRDRRDQIPEVHDPVEDRCTEKLKVSHPALNAVYVGYNEFVKGDILAANRVTVKGWVQGDIQSTNSRVLVTSSGQVDGDIRAPEIIVKPGGVVLGKQKITEHTISIPVELLTESFSEAGMWVVFSFTVALMLFAYLASSLMPRQSANVTSCIAEHKAKTFLLGLLFIFLIPFIITLVAVTIVGLAVLPLIPLAYLFALALGMGASGRPLTRFLLRSFGTGEPSLMFYSLTGVLVYMILWTVVALLLGSGESNHPVAWGFGIFSLVLSIVATIWPLATGVGAAVLTRFGFRDYISFRDGQVSKGTTAPAPAPPPIAEKPPGPSSPRSDTTAKSSGESGDIPEPPPQI